MNALAEDITHFQIYTTADGLSHRVIHTILQDSKGYIWMATWNGLCRYDGSEFLTYNKLEDGQLIGRISRISETRDGEILCLTQQDECYSFSPVSKSFASTSQIPPKKQGKDPYTVIALKDGLEISNQKDTFFLPIQTRKDLRTTLHAFYTDRTGNLWINCNDVLYKVSFLKERYQYHTHLQDLDSPIYGTEIRSLLHQGEEIWLAGKNGKIYVYNADGSFSGYLSAQGGISKEETFFGANVYSMMYKYGKIWMASKGKGLFMLTPDGNGRYRINQWCDFNGDSEIYTFAFDSVQNLWVGTYNKGIYKIAYRQDYGSTPKLINKVSGTRHMRLIDKYMIVASKKGLLVYDSEGTLKQRVGNYDCSYIHTAKNGTTYVATMGFGLYKLVFKHDNWELLPYKIPSMPTETILSIAEDINGELYFIKDDSFIKISTNGQVQVFGENYFGQNLTFSEAEPFIYNHTLWAGTADGCLTIDLQAPDKSNPPFYWKEIQEDTISIPTDVKEIEAVEGQEIRILPIVLDYAYPGKIQYKYRMDSASHWMVLNEKEPIILRQLTAGTHLLEVQYTDSKGIWSKESANLKIKVHLLVSELAAYICLIVFMMLIIAGMLYYWKRKRINSSKEEMKADVTESEDTRFLDEAKKYVLQNLSNDTLTIERMGEHLGVSRSVLYQRMKENIDKTPAQFIKDIRIKEAEGLLKSQKYTITEVADRTGFCDAKYFSKVFKKETGKVPTVYLKEQNLSK